MGEPLWKPRFPEKFQHLIGEKKEQFGYYVNVSASPIPSDSTLSHKTPREFSCVGRGEATITL